MTTQLPEKEHKPLIGITCGDTNGIGLEVVMKAFMDTRMLQICTPVLYVSSKMISAHRKALNLQDFNYTTVKSIEAALPRKVNVVSCWEEDVPLQFGQASDQSAKCAITSLEAATTDLAAGKIEAIITAPINKQSMQQAGFRYPGHTEYFANKFNAKEHVMLMVGDALRVAVVAGHIPMKEVPGQINTERILKKLKVMDAALKQDFGITRPRIAVLGLNPHAGDGGVLGTEEKDIIRPAVEKAFSENILAFGPFSADGFFASPAINQYDAVLAMYHDQGLAPFKTIAFDYGVNYTAGLSVVRSSPDHGTGFDIAGKNIASESSTRAAVYLCCDIIEKRAEYKELTANPLQSGFSRLSKDQ